MERLWRPGLPIDLPGIYLPTEMDEWRLYETEDLETFVQQAMQFLDQRGHRQVPSASLSSWFARTVLDERQTHNNITVANYPHSQHIYLPPPPPQVTYAYPQQQTSQVTHHWYPYSYSDSPRVNHTARYLTVDRVPSWVQPEVVEAEAQTGDSMSSAEKQKQNKSHFRPKKKAMRSDRDSGSEPDTETEQEQPKRRAKGRSKHDGSNRSRHDEPGESDHDNRARRPKERRRSRLDTQSEDDSEQPPFRRSAKNNQCNRKSKSKQEYHDTSDHEVRKPHHHKSKSRKSASKYCPTHHMYHVPRSPSPSTSPFSSPSPSPSHSPSPSSPSPPPSTQPPPFDPHATLGTTPSTPLNIIRITANQLSLRYHPDKQVGKSEAEVRRAAERMVEVNRAREVLLGGG